MATVPSPSRSWDNGYPTSDGKPMAETDVHYRLMTDLRFELEQFFRDDSDVYVSGNILIYYVEGNPNLPQTDAQGMLNNPEWSAFYLWKNGAIVPENAARCPKTLSALADAPLARRMIAKARQVLRF